jgi:hypothetical protein
MLSRNKRGNILGAARRRRWRSVASHIVRIRHFSISIMRSLVSTHRSRVSPDGTARRRLATTGFGLLNSPSRSTVPCSRAFYAFLVLQKHTVATFGGVHIDGFLLDTAPDCAPGTTTQIRYLKRADRLTHILVTRGVCRDSRAVPMLHAEASDQTMSRCPCTRRSKSTTDGRGSTRLG